MLDGSRIVTAGCALYVASDVCAGGCGVVGWFSVVGFVVITSCWFDWIDLGSLWGLRVVMFVFVGC